jgi:hypothetical protein
MFNVVVNVVCWYNNNIYSLIMHLATPLQQQKKDDMNLYTFISFQLCLLVFNKKTSFIGYIINSQRSLSFIISFYIIFVH